MASHLATCTPCGRQWRSLREAHCTACHRHFSTDSAAELHRTGPFSARECVDPLTIRTTSGRPRLTLNASPFGALYRHAGTDDPRSPSNRPTVTTAQAAPHTTPTTGADQ